MDRIPEWDEMPLLDKFKCMIRANCNISEAEKVKEKNITRLAEGIYSEFSHLQQENENLRVECGGLRLQCHETRKALEAANKGITRLKEENERLKKEVSGYYDEAKKALDQRNALQSALDRICKEGIKLGEMHTTSRAIYETYNAIMDYLDQKQEKPDIKPKECPNHGNELLLTDDLYCASCGNPMMTEVMNAGIPTWKPVLPKTRLCPECFGSGRKLIIITWTNHPEYEGEPTRVKCSTCSGQGIIEGG